MLGKRRLVWTLRLLALDVAVLVAAFFCAYGLRVLLDRPLGRAAAPLGYYTWLLAVVVPIWVGLVLALGGYGIAWTTRSRVGLAAGVAVAGTLLTTAGLFFVQESDVNRSLLLIFAALSAVGLWGARSMLRSSLRRRAADEWANVALVVGTDHRAASVISALRRYPEARWTVRGCLGLEAPEAGQTVLGVPVMGSLQDLPERLQNTVVDEVFFAVSPDQLDRITDALEICESLGVDTRVLIDIYRPTYAQPFVEELFALPFYGFSPRLTRQGALVVKRILDVVMAALGLAVLAPFLLVVAGLVKASSRGPAIFRQERSGFRGRRFLMYKFRTMVQGAEGMREQLQHLNEMAEPVFKARDDPRLTRVGRILRRTSIDELPQLLNVVRGDMSLVGPRPLPLYEANQIKGAQRRRLAYRPGITGLWQVSGRSMVDFDQWMQMDLFYVDHWSLSLDVRILLRTVLAVLHGRGAV